MSSILGFPGLGLMELWLFLRNFGESSFFATKKDSYVHAYNINFKSSIYFLVSVCNQVPTCFS